MKAQTDFADWFSPMLVKELRQGMRSKAFVTWFLLVQGAMIFVAIVGLAASASQQDISAMTGFYWTIIVGLLVVIMPMSGLGAVFNERKANTLELIFLTRLTPRRIITGKWFAIVAQTLLLVCALLPYAVLRYFLGGVNVPSDLLRITMLLLASALLSGVAVGLSPQSSRVTRGLLAVGVIVGMQVIVPLFASAMFRSSSLSVTGGRAMDWTTYLGLGLMGVILLLLMFEFGASKIAPAADNHSTSRRLLGFAALAVVGILSILQRPTVAIWSCALVLLVPICVSALCEPPRPITSIYQPFVRFGFWGKAAGRLLYPGWPSGVFFSAIVLLVMLPIGFRESSVTLGTEWMWWVALCAAGALYMPVALIHAFLPRTRHPFVIYIVIQFVCVMLVAVAALLDGFKMTDLRLLVAVIPTCGLLLSGSDAIGDTHLHSLIVATGSVTAASICLLLVKMWAPWRQIAVWEKAAAALPPARSIDASDPQPAE